MQKLSMQSAIAQFGFLTTLLGAFSLVTAANANELSAAQVDRSTDGISTQAIDAKLSVTKPSDTKLLKDGVEPSPDADTPIGSAPAIDLPQPGASSPRVTSKSRQLAQATSTGIQILSPKDATTSQKSTDLIVQYSTGTKVQVLVNQKLLNLATPTQIQDNPTTGQTTQVWYQIPLKSGKNVLTVRAEGTPTVTTTVTVRETAAKVQFLPFKEARLPADGRSALAVEGQILDEAGQPLQQDAVVTLTSSAGKFIGADYDKDRPGFQVLARSGKFRAQLQSGLEPQMVRIRAGVDRHELVTQAERRKPTNTPIPTPNSSPTFPLAPASSTPPPQRGTAPYLTTPNPYDKTLEAYTQVEFTTNLRPFILSGQMNLRFGQAGLDYYNSFQNFLRPSLLDQGYRVDFSTAVFASGRVGEWLVTAAYNNQRPLNQDCNRTTRLFRDPQLCDQVYPVFGDSSTVDYLTPSIDSVYFKIERTSPVFGAGSDYAMWGDYTTQEFARASQFYTATTRQLHGFKANYNLGNLQATLSYANNISGFQRDAIAPNGTSGYYYLSRRLVIAGSENIFMESEELLRPGTVLERKPLYRGVDYEIDYDRGAVLFRRNINTLDFDPFGRTLKRQIIVTYQFDGLNDGGGKFYAGRAQYNFSREVGRESWAGFTYQREDQGDQRLEVYGGDVLVSLGQDAQLVGEIARSDYDSIFRGDIGGYAYRFELFGTITPGLFAKGYYRSVESGFTNNATTSFTPGQTRYGAEASARVTPTTQALVQFDREINFGIAPAVRGISSVATIGFGDLFAPTNEPIPGSQVDNSLTTFRAGVLQKLGPVELGLDYVRRSRQDRVFPGRLEADTNQIVSRLNYPIQKDLIFRVQDERNLGGGSNSDDPLYPSRTTIGLDWILSPDVTVRVAQQFLERTSQINTNSFTSLDIISDKRISDDTTFTSRYSILNGVNGWNSQSAMGLNHRIKLAPGVRLNLAYERVATDLFAYTAAGQQYLQPVAVGQSAASLGLSSYSSYIVGLDYTDNPNFKANGRVEYRDGDGSGNTMVISAAAAGKLSPSLTALGRYQQANFANQLLVDTGLSDTVNLKMGLAYRNPADDKFNALLRYEFRQNPGTTPDTILIGSGTGSNVHLFAVEAIYAPNFRWEFYGKLALRSTKSYLARDLLGTNAITLGQVRAAYRFGYRWDAAAEVRWISQSVVDFDEVGLAAELGYYMTPNLRIALGYNFGSANDRDLGRNKDGVYVTLSLKLDQLLSGFGVSLPDRKVSPPQQQESIVKPVANQPTAPPTSATPPANTQTTASDRLEPKSELEGAAQ